MKREIKFQFDYECAPIWLIGEGDWLISSEGYFVGCYSLDILEPEERLKGEVELEQKVQLIYDVYCRIWDINEFPAGEPYIGFEDEREKTEFFDACDYVIKRMREIFGDEFTVREYDGQIIAERSWGCRKK